MTDLYQRSIEVILGNQAPSGAYIASPTFPTYRFCWFRDGTYIAYAMDLVGERASARRFYDWALGAVAARAEQTEQAIAAAAHGIPPAELLMHTRYTLDGAIGNEDWPNFQLDGFGTLLWGVAEHLARGDETLPDAWRTPVDLLAQYLSALWRYPCYDCWEEFGDRVHTATLAALYGGLRAASGLLGSAEPNQVEEIRRFVLAECVADGHLCKSVGNPAVDANLMHAATPYRLLDPQDPMMRATIDRIETDLRRGGLRRYADDSFYGGGEWILLTAYLGWHYVERDEPDRALPVLAWIERQATADGHLPEQVAVNLNHPNMLPVWTERWGANARPLLWSHAAYVTLVAHLSPRHAAGTPPSCRGHTPVIPRNEESRRH